MGLLNFGLPRTGDPPRRFLHLSRRQAARHDTRSPDDTTRPTPWPFSRDNKRTHPTRDHRILVCQFRLLSLILGKQKEREREREREREKARVIEKERKRERPRVEIERDQQKRREAENKTTTG